MEDDTKSNPLEGRTPASIDRNDAVSVIVRYASGEEYFGREFTWMDSTTNKLVTNKLMSSTLAGHYDAFITTETNAKVPMPDVKQPKPEADPEPGHFLVQIFNVDYNNTVEMLFYNEEEGKKFIVSEGGFHSISVVKKLLGNPTTIFLIKDIMIEKGMTIVIDVDHGAVSYRLIDERNLTMPNEEEEPSPCKE